MGHFSGGGEPREPDIGAAGNGLWLQAGVEQKGRTTEATWPHHPKPDGFARGGQEIL